MNDQAAAVRLDPERYRIGHAVFQKKIHENSDVPFTSWKHPFLKDDEIDYKEKAYWRAQHLLELERWPRWLENEPGNILEAVRQASVRETSGNLVYAQWYPNGPTAPVEHLGERHPAVVRSIAEGLFDWFYDRESRSFAARFDAFADRLRNLPRSMVGQEIDADEVADEPPVTCQVSWLTYLAFLFDRERYFPIRSTYFEGLVRFYGNPDFKLSHQVSFERYRSVLDLGDLLADRLQPELPEPDSVELQSYMWVVAHALKHEYAWEPPDDLDRGDGSKVDDDMLLRRRCERALRRERRGLAGERYVVKAERERLRAAGRPDLAEDVDHVAARDDGCGYDVRSFTAEGEERHLEVKATSRSPDAERGFHLTERERQVAESSPHWSVYRVWSVDGEPEGRDLGNVVTGSASDGWRLEEASWYCFPDATGP